MLQMENKVTKKISELNFLAITRAGLTKMQMLKCCYTAKYKKHTSCYILSVNELKRGAKH
jgi:hypothetical protein